LQYNIQAIAKGSLRLTKTLNRNIKLSEILPLLRAISRLPSNWLEGVNQRALMYPDQDNMYALTIRLTAINIHTCNAKQEDINDFSHF